MLSKLRVQHYKSLFDTEVDLEPLTVFIGPNGSGKSNICESLAVLSDFLQRLLADTNNHNVIPFFVESLSSITQQKQSTIGQNTQNIESKFWHGELDYLCFEAKALSKTRNISIASQSIQEILINIRYLEQEIYIKFQDGFNRGNREEREEARNYTSELRRDLIGIDRQYPNSFLSDAFRKVRIYDFSPINLAGNNPTDGGMKRTGQGIAYALVDILHANRKSFDELEERFTRLVPNIHRISLPRKESRSFDLELIDRYSEHHIPASDISDGTLRILAFLTALYQEDTPSIICFEELENGVHPWLLHKMMELLKIVSTEGINGKPVQILITTHSPLLLDYVEPHQVRAVELDHEGKTQVHALPTDSVRFQKALEAYDGALSELWFTNVFGGNPV
jgi:predicted ATPase